MNGLSDSFSSDDIEKSWFRSQVREEKEQEILEAFGSPELLKKVASKKSNGSKSTSIQSQNKVGMQNKGNEPWRWVKPPGPKKVNMLVQTDIVAIEMSESRGQVEEFKSGAELSSAQVTIAAVNEEKSPLSHSSHEMARSGDVRH